MWNAFENSPLLPNRADMDKAFFFSKDIDALYIYTPFLPDNFKKRKVWAKRVRIIDIDFRPNICNPSPAMLTSFIIK